MEQISPGLLSLIGALFAARASRTAPRCRITANSCRTGPKRIPTRIPATISTRMNICSPQAMTNENADRHRSSYRLIREVVNPLRASVYNRLPNEKRPRVIPLLLRYRHSHINNI
jgi:hypothetical protein